MIVESGYQSTTELANRAISGIIRRTDVCQATGGKSGELDLAYKETGHLKIDEQAKRALRIDPFPKLSWHLLRSLFMSQEALEREIADT